MGEGARPPDGSATGPPMPWHWSPDESGTATPLGSFGSRTTPVAGGWVIELRGELCPATLAMLRVTLRRVARCAGDAVVDLAATTRADPAAIAELAGLQANRRDRGGRLAVRPAGVLDGQVRHDPPEPPGADGFVDGESWWAKMLDEQADHHRAAGLVAQAVDTTPVAALDAIGRYATRAGLDRSVVSRRLLDGTLDPTSMAQPADGSGATGSASSVLYIEDDEVNILLMRRVVAHRSGLALDVATTGAAGLAAARTHPPAVVLVDLDLPDMSGEDVIRDLRLDERTAGLPVVVLTADQSPSRAERLRTIGVDAYLTKPFVVDHLLDTVTTAAADHAQVAT